MSRTKLLNLILGLVLVAVLQTGCGGPAGPVATVAPPLPTDITFTISSCIPKPEEYTLEIVNHTDISGDVKRHCNADGLFTNNSDQKLMFSTFRVQNYGGWVFEKWEFFGSYTIVEPGQTVEYAEFYRCVGGSCKDGAWYYIARISILYSTPECMQYTHEPDEKVPESIIEIQNPCDW